MMIHAESVTTIREAEMSDVPCMLDLLAEQAAAIDDGRAEYSFLLPALREGYGAEELQSRIAAAHTAPDQFFTQVAIDERGRLSGFACAQVADPSSYARQFTLWQGLAVAERPGTADTAEQLESHRRRWAIPLGRAVAAQVVTAEGSRTGTDFLQAHGFDRVGVIDSPRTLPNRYFMLLSHAALAGDAH